MPGESLEMRDLVGNRWVKVNVKEVFEINQGCNITFMRRVTETG